MATESTVKHDSRYSSDCDCEVNAQERWEADDDKFRHALANGLSSFYETATHLLVARCCSRNSIRHLCSLCRLMNACFGSNERGGNSKRSSVNGEKTRGTYFFLVTNLTPL